MGTIPREYSSKLYRNLFWLVLAAITLIRLAFAGNFGLGTDESHYVMYARHLAWGYFDHPPMVAFLAALATIFGKSPFFIRLGPIICSTMSLVVLRYLALALYKDERIPFWAIILLHLMPYQHLLMVGLLPDATLNVFWCATLFAAWCAIKNGKWTAWLLAGFLFGAALLSKYHAVLLPLCLFGYLLTSAAHRHWLSRIQPYTALLVGVAVFLPNIIWNASNGWISYKFQLARGGGGGFEVGKIFETFGGQLAAWSPVICGLLIVSLIVSLRNKHLAEADRFAIWMSIPVFVFFCGIGIIGKILPHWPSVGWWTGSLVVTKIVLQGLSQEKQSAKQWRNWSVAAVVSGAVMTLILYAGILYPIVAPIYNQARSISAVLHRYIPSIQPLKPYQAKFDISNDLYGWDKIADEVEAIRASMPRPEKTFIFCHRFFPASQLAVQLSADTVVTSLRHRPNQYHLWFSPKDYAGWDALFIDEDRHFKGPGRYRPLFGGVNSKPEIIKVLRDGLLAHEIRVYKYFDFRGEFEKR